MPTLAIELPVTVMPIAWTLPAALTIPAQWTAAGAALAMGIGLLNILSARPRIAQTTLFTAWCWSLAALTAWWLAVLAGAFALTGGNSSSYSPLQLAALLLSVTPVVALLGAKRPQHRVWSFVVLTLWGILALPAAEAILIHRGQRLDLGVFRGSLVWILILLGPVNYVPTRFWHASLIFAAGQIVALGPFLPLLRRSLFENSPLAGLSFAAAALLAAWLASRRKTNATSALDRLWLDFRDTFGLLWSLRVQERFNAAAKQHGWNVELTWTGFVRHSDVPASDHIATEPHLRTTFKSLLRRFVSKAWIENHS